MYRHKWNKNQMIVMIINNEMWLYIHDHICTFPHMCFYIVEMWLDAYLGAGDFMRKGHSGRRCGKVSVDDTLISTMLGVAAHAPVVPCTKPTGDDRREFPIHCLGSAAENQPTRRNIKNQWTKNDKNVQNGQESRSWFEVKHPPQHPLATARTYTSSQDPATAESSLEQCADGEDILMPASSSKTAEPWLSRVDKVDYSIISGHRNADFFGWI